MSNGAPTLSVRFIMQSVAQAYGLDIRLLTSPRRAREVARPRQVAMWLAVKLMPAISLPAIGAAFGNRDHTTVMHAIRRVDSLADSDEAFFAILEMLKERIVAATLPAEPPAPIARGADEAKARHVGRLLHELVAVLQELHPDDTLRRAVLHYSKGLRT